jgi:tripeptide aminopeptidase
LPPLNTPAIVQDFLEFVTTPSHPFRERAMADLLKGLLGRMGLEVFEDKAGEMAGGDSGNLIALWPGDPGIEPVLFSAHMDRVSNPGRINPVVDEARGVIASDGTTILGADDAAGLAAIIDGIRRVGEEGARHGDVELALTIAEEVGLKGSRWLDYSKIRSKMGYVLDSGGPVGTLVNQAPTQRTVKIDVHGKSAHAGMCPEEGVNAIRLAALAMTSLREGRLSPVTTSNFGIIHAGEATNIVCDLAKLEAEARSHDEAELDAYCQELEEAFRRLSDLGGRVELAWSEEYKAFHVLEDDPVIRIAAKALSAIGRERKVVRGGGGMDANHFNLKGVKSVGLSVGYADVHTSRETQSIPELIAAGEAVAAIIKTVASGV